ncbi:MAG TPA: TMEM175 family protein [Sphingomicrobium sp.]|nr:TMEM175 family protein [Sphingomicrobium sp.]
MATPQETVSEPARRDDLEGEGAIRGTARMEAFADGVFAIAFTLPIVHIVIPEVKGNGADLGYELIALWPAYMGYVLASLIIGLYWIQHHFSGAIYRTTGHWFLVATVLFLTLIGFISYPARVFAEHLVDPAAWPVSAQYLVLSLTATSLGWLLKWSVGCRRGQVDARLDPGYTRRLDRRYRLLAIGNLIAALLVFWRWEIGLGLSGLLVLSLALPPETPRYITESPIVEGES